MRARAFAAAATTALAFAFLFASAHAQDASAGLRTFEGGAGGGTFSLTLNGDLTAVLRAQVTDATFIADPQGLACGATTNGVDSFDPPIAVDDPQYSARIFDVSGLGDVSVVLIDIGSVTDEKIEAIARYAQVTSGYICESARYDVTYHPVDNPPASGNLVFAGDVSGGGTITLATTSDSSGLTFLRLTDVATTCLTPDDTLSAIDFFDPVLPAYANGGFTYTFDVWQSSLSATGIDLSASLAAPDRLEGEMRLQNLPYYFCDETLSWSADLQEQPEPTATPRPVTPTATSPLVTTPGMTPSQLPDTGAAPGSSGPATWPVLALLAVLAITSTTAAALARRR